MDQVFREKKQGKPRILVAPLDWGLGHATRCVPIIRELIAQGAAPLIAAEGPQESLLRSEFPHLSILPLPGYRVRYGRSASSLIGNIILQVPRILRQIRAENQWLETVVAEQQIDAVISDNRYGLYHSHIPCIFMTHQLRIKTPFGRSAENILQKRNYRLINRFTRCWIPDISGVPNLAGELAHPSVRPKIPVEYIGHLSRLKKITQPEQKGHLLVLLSGPEPQRTLLEEKILRQIAHYPGTATIVRGLPGTERFIPSTHMIQCHNHLPADKLNHEFAKAEFIIARSGYSSVMDIIQLGKKSILIPTPGQTEQQYLAEWLQLQQLAYCSPQKDFLLASVLANATKYSYQSWKGGESPALNEAVGRLLSDLS